MRSGDSSRAADARNHLATPYLLPLARQVFVVVRIDREESRGVADNDHIAIAAQPVAVNHLAIVDGIDRRPGRRRDVDAVVKIRAPRPEMRIDRPGYRPDEILPRA